MLLQTGWRLMLLGTAAAVTGDQRDWACLYGSVWGTPPDQLQRTLGGMHMAQQQQQLSVTGSWGLAKYGHPGQRLCYSPGDPTIQQQQPAEACTKGTSSEAPSCAATCR